MKKRNKTNLIILHCSATKEGQDFKEKDIKQWHLARGFETTGYHYIIDLDGTIEKGRDESYIGAHCSGKNDQSIGICYIGGLDKNGNAKDTRTPAQKESLYKLVKQMVDKYHLSIKDVYGHRAFTNKACPCFDTETFRQEYRIWKTKQNYNIKIITCPHCGKSIELTE